MNSKMCHPTNKRIKYFIFTDQSFSKFYQNSRNIFQKVNVVTIENRVALLVVVVFVEFNGLPINQFFYGQVNDT